jgi:pimeloyl-ACP methyl ester carboxylesterase
VGVPPSQRGCATLWPRVAKRRSSARVCGMLLEPRLPCEPESRPRSCRWKATSLARVLVTVETLRMDAGPVLYTWSGDAAIAYQVVGEGERDLFYLGSWGSTLDLSWSFPPHARFLTGLAAFSRLVLHDGRGRGSSDAPSEGRVVTLEERADDLLAVADAVNTYNPVLFGAQESSIVAMAVAATRPWAFSALVLYEPTPVWSRTDELPWETPKEETRALVESLRRTSSYDEWTRSHVRRALPSLAGDPRAVAWLATAYRAYAPPAATIAEIEYLDTADLVDLLPKIALPTLVLHRPDASGWSSQTARYVAEHIPDAREVALSGRDQYPWAGDADAVIGEIEEFVTGSRGAGTRTTSARAIATVLFSDIVASTTTAATVGDAAWRDLLGKHHETVRAALVRHRGIE